LTYHGSSPIEALKANSFFIDRFANKFEDYRVFKTLKFSPKGLQKARLIFKIALKNKQVQFTLKG